MKTALLCFLALALTLTPRLAAHSADEPTPRTDEGWVKRQELLNQRAAEAGGKAQVIFIGDSITQGWEGAGREVWEKHYAPLHAVNLGIGGDRTQHVLWRLQNGNLKGLKPKAAVIMIGTNNSNGEDNTVEQIADGVTAIVKHLRQTVPETKILLLGIFPRNENPSPQRGKLAQVNQILQKLDDQQSVFYLDIGHRFLDARGLIPRALMPDFLHLSPAGYAAWAEAIEPLLRRLLGETAAAATTADLSGEWVWTIQGPDGNPVSAPLILKREGDRVSGRFARGSDGWLEIENGRIRGDEFSWTVNRDRPGGGTMTYQMTGKLVDGAITGRAKTEMDGRTVDVEWSARRN